MLYEYVSIGYSASNMLLALIIFFKATRSLTVKFYLFLVASLVTFGLCGFLSPLPLTPLQSGIIGSVGAFLFALFPFFFPEYKVTAVQVARANGPTEGQETYRQHAEQSRRILAAE